MEFCSAPSSASHFSKCIKPVTSNGTGFGTKTKQMKKQIAIITPFDISFNTFTKECNETDLVFKHISCLEDLRGQEFVSFICLNDWRKMENCLQVLNYTKTRIKDGRK